MKTIFSSPAFTLLFLVLATVSNAQNNQLTGNKPVLPGVRTELHKNTRANHEIAISHEWERIKTKRIPAGIYLQSEAYNPYRPYNPQRIVMPAPTNGYDDKNKAILGDLLRSIIIERGHKH